MANIAYSHELEVIGGLSSVINHSRKVRHFLSPLGHHAWALLCVA